MTCKARPTSHYIWASLQHRPDGRSKWRNVGVPKESNTIPGAFSLDFSYFCEEGQYRIYKKIRAVSRGKVENPEGPGRVEYTRGRCK